MSVIKKNIPNFITCLNLACGGMGILSIAYHQEYHAIYLMLLALVFDFMDGLVARLLKVTSSIGRDLDSLADVVTFGLLPTIMLFDMLHHAWYSQVKTNTILVPTYMRTYAFDLFSYPTLAIMLVVFSAVRLARFNNDTEQGYHFKGLATPACGILIASIYYYFLQETIPGGPGFSSYMMPVMRWLLLNPLAIIGIVVALSFLLVSNIKLIAFKFKGFGWKANQWKYILLMVSAPLVIFLGFASAPIILILYILISQIHFRFNAHEI